MAGKDWVSDETLPAEETLRRFAELSPEETVGPPLSVPPAATWGQKLRLSDVRITSKRGMSIGRSTGLIVSR